MPLQTLNDISSSENFASQLHSVFLLFPIIFFTAVLICDLCYGWGKKKAVLIGHWLVIAGLISCVPAIITGQESAKFFNPTAPYLQQHVVLSYLTAVAASLYSGLRLAALVWDLKIKPAVYIGLSVMIAALVSWTSDYGGLIKKESTLFIESSKSVSGKYDQDALLL